MSLLQNGVQIEEKFSILTRVCGHVGHDGFFGGRNRGRRGPILGGRPGGLLRVTGGCGGRGGAPYVRDVADHEENENQR